MYIYFLLVSFAPATGAGNSGVKMIISVNDTYFKYK